MTGSATVQGVACDRRKEICMKDRRFSAGRYVALGAAIGAAVGAGTHNIAIGLAMGVAIGALLGRFAG